MVCVLPLPSHAFEVKANANPPFTKVNSNTQSKSNATHKRTRYLITAPLLFSLALQGCVTTGTQAGGGSLRQIVKNTFASDDPCANNARNIGVLAGAVVGALVGNQAGDGKAAGILIGLGLGGALGAFIGSEVDKRECELSKIQAKYKLDMQVAPLTINQESANTGNTNTPFNTHSNTTSQKVGLSVSIADQANKPQFLNGSDILEEDAKLQFSEIAKQYSAHEKMVQIDVNKTPEEKNKFMAELRKSRILLIGHTDDIGNSKNNAMLSEKRSLAVAKIFKAAGVEESQLYYQGAGETLPAADNVTIEGRAKNRRVEIVDLSNEKTFNLYLQNRRAKTEFYRAAEATDVQNLTEVTNAKVEVKSKTSRVALKAGKAQPKKTNVKEIAIKKTTAVSSEVVATANASATVKASTTKTNPSTWIDFGGAPATNQNAAINLGQMTQSKSRFSLISEAQASDLSAISSCNLDRPRETGAVKSLSSGKEYATNAHLPSLNGRSWQDTVGGHLIMLNRVAVLRDGAMLANPPELKVYTNYNASKNRNAKPELSIEPAVNIYQGSNGLLYRIFTQGSHGLQCMDVLMPLDNSGVAKAGKVVYGNKGIVLVADFKPSMIR